LLEDPRDLLKHSIKVGLLNVYCLQLGKIMHLKTNGSDALVANGKLTKC